MTRHRLMPSDTPDYMADAWLGCVVYAAGNPGMLARFQNDTGINSAEMIAAMAADTDKPIIEAFVGWVNSTLWGPIDGDAP